MLKFTQLQMDRVVLDDREKLAQIAATDLFSRNELYADMPLEVRQLLAEAAVDEARRNGMTTLESLFGLSRP